MDRAPMLDLLVFMASFGLVGLLMVGALVGVVARRWHWAGRLAAAGLAVGVAYLAAVLVVSTNSETRILPRGEVKRFCGFYIDCHIGVSVDDVDTMQAIGQPGNERRSRGRFHVVTVRVSSDASRAELEPVDLEAYVVLEGRRVARDLEAERALGAGTAAVSGFDAPLRPWSHYLRRVVFDLPADAADPALDVRGGWVIDRGIEALLIGDEDSLLHPPTLLSLSPWPPR